MRNQIQPQNQSYAPTAPSPYTGNGNGNASHSFQNKPPTIQPESQPQQPIKAKVSVREEGELSDGEVDEVQVTSTPDLGHNSPAEALKLGSVSQRPASAQSGKLQTQSQDIGNVLQSFGRGGDSEMALGNSNGTHREY